MQAAEQRLECLRPPQPCPAGFERYRAWEARVFRLGLGPWGRGRAWRARLPGQQPPPSTQALRTETLWDCYYEVGLPAGLFYVQLLDLRGAGRAMKKESYSHRREKVPSGRTWGADKHQNNLSPLSNRPKSPYSPSNSTPYEWSSQFSRPP